MRRARNCGWAMSLATVAALLLPAAGLAKPGEGPLGSSVLSGFRVQGSDGYRIQVLTIGPKLVLLGAAKGQVAATYAVTGRIAGNRLEARFGGLGRISVRFYGFRSARARGEKQCGQPPRFGEAGLFKGTIRFAGEGGYTKVNAHHARGVVIGSDPPDCPGKARSSLTFPFAAITTHLTAIARRAGKTVAFDALAVDGDHRLAVTGSLQEHRGRMRIFRVASAIVGGEQAFVASRPGEHPAHATVKPPKPFSGAGLFQEDSSLSNSWTGSISAWFPGVGKVRLAGPRFASSFCRLPVRGEEECDLFPPVRRSLQLGQDSGSQSHALREVMLSWSRYLRNSSSSAGSTP